MGKSAKKKPRPSKANPKDEEQQEEEAKFDHPIILSSDDEADDDLSLKIVEKAKLRSLNGDANSNPSPFSVEPEVIITEVKKKTSKKKEKEEKIGAQDDAVGNMETNEQGDDPKEPETLEVNPVEKSDNIVLRKLLRGPRYFDPPDNSWGNCYNCGEGDHTAVNCTSARRKKPCFVCGSFEHNVKQCKQGKDCFICQKGGHRAKDCPEKSIGGSQKAKLCLKCGNSGHEMFSCKSIYSPDDLKEIQCYVCKYFGHLCCVNYTSAGPREVSCYRCGQLGHTGWECGRVRAETTGTGTPSSCYKCGEEGHMARKCTSSAKGKRKNEFSVSKHKHSKDNNYGTHVGIRSAPPKRNRTQYGQQPSSSHQPKPRGRGGWSTEDPADHHWNYNANGHGWGSPRTPSRYTPNDRYHHGGGGGGGGYGWNPQQYGSAVGSNGYQHRYSTSKFGNSSSSYGKRSYGWDY